MFRVLYKEVSFENVRRNNKQDNRYDIIHSMKDGYKLMARTLRGENIAAAEPILKILNSMAGIGINLNLLKDIYCCRGIRKSYGK